MRNEILVGLFEHARLPKDIIDEVYTTHAREYSGAMVNNPSFAPYAVNLVARTRQTGRRRLIRTGTREALDAILDSNERSDYVLGAIIETWKLGPKDQMRFVQRKLPSVVIWWVRERSGFTDEAKTYVGRNGLHGKWHHTEFKWDCSAYFSAAARSSVLRRKLPEVGTGFNTDLVAGLTLSELIWRSGDCFKTETSQLITERLGHKNNSATAQAWRNFMFLAEHTPTATLSSALDVAKTLAIAE